MRKSLVVSVILLVSVTGGRLHAQPGVMSLYADPAFTTCNVANPSAVQYAYVVLDATSGATAVQYALSDNTGGAIVWLADQYMFPLVLGNSQSGVAVSFGGCLQGQIHVQNVVYTVESEPGICTFIEFVPDPGAPTGGLEAVNCSQVKWAPESDILTFRADGTCWCSTIRPVEASTWGRVKSLYR